jgi:DNA mismatch repair protein MutL
VERPLSALKELLENALDGGARRVEIRVRGGLEHHFSVTDDGIGIPRGELALALEAHATSKVRDADDLARLTTLGFRGEALPAIARVSRLSIETRARDEDEGSRLEAHAGELGVTQPLGRAAGTTVTVEDLFFNAPARRKFLRSSAGELRAAARLISAYALAFPEVAVRFEVDGRERLDAPPATDGRARAQAVLGTRFLEQCLEAEAEHPGLRLHALLGLPELARVTREAQVFLVNRRWVQSPLLSQAIRNAYGNLIPPARHPACVLALTIDPASLDVNVHPTKREVRFAHEDALFSFVSRTCAAPLSRLVPRYAPRIEVIPAPELGALVRDAGPQMPLWGGRGAGRGATAAAGSAAPPGGPAPLLAFPRAGAAGPAETRESSALAAEEGESTKGGAPVRPRFANLWQLHDTYILAPVSGGLVIIDQHAAHERILYESALVRLREHAGAAQQLLFPQLLDLTRAEFDLVVEIQEPLSRLGFDLAPISPPSVLLRGVPPGVASRDPAQLLRDLLDAVSEESGRQLPDDELADRLAKSYACHAAVRAGDPLGLEEMNALVDQLFATSLPHGDPHGRPSLVRLDLRELHARFGRGG